MPGSRCRSGISLSATIPSSRSSTAGSSCGSANAFAIEPLRATYRFKSFPEVGAEIDFLTGTGPDTLASHGIEAKAVPPTRDDFYDVLAGGAFDVLHVSCHAESLHESIGWPNVFLRAGAGAFVGSSWSVRDKPAALFCQTFYDALLNDRMLYEAASAAREAAKQLGDASWLAYKVYGHPGAKRKIT
jgi:CHAT domain-containing protein